MVTNEKISSSAFENENTSKMGSGLRRVVFKCLDRKPMREAFKLGFWRFFLSVRKQNRFKNGIRTETCCLEVPGPKADARSIQAWVPEVLLQRSKTKTLQKWDQD